MPLFAALLLTAGAANAQTAATQTAASADQTQGRGNGQGRGRGQGNPEEMAQRQSQRMATQLGLNADQTAKVQQILLARSQEMQTMRSQAQGGGDRSQMRQQMQANRTKYEEQFKAVLTPEQYTKFSTMQADRMNRGGGPGRGYGVENGATPPAGKVKIKEDKIKIKAAKADKKAAKAATQANQ
jgi:hypothetical protein